MGETLTLTSGQYWLVFNMLSLAIASMLGGFIFFVGSRKRVGKSYRGALTISSVIVGIAAYHYLRIFQSWEGATTMLEAGNYAFDSAVFNEAYRYADWIVTVPLLLVEAVAVLDLDREKSRPLIGKLSIAAFLMIALGYPGEMATETGTRALWGTLSTIPFVYILYVLWTELDDAMGEQPGEVPVLMRNLKLLLLATWGVYPIAYLAPMIGFEGAGSVADIAAKAGFGVMIYAIAREKTLAEGGVPAEETARERSTVGAGGAQPAMAE
jgi:bacteriorhodopsin